MKTFKAMLIVKVIDWLENLIYNNVKNEEISTEALFKLGNIKSSIEYYYRQEGIFL